MLSLYVRKSEMPLYLPQKNDAKKKKDIILYLILTYSKNALNQSDPLPPCQNDFVWFSPC